MSYVTIVHKTHAGREPCTNAFSNLEKTSNECELRQVQGVVITYDALVRKFTVYNWIHWTLNVQDMEEAYSLDFWIEYLHGMRLKSKSGSEYFVCEVNKLHTQLWISAFKL